MQGIVSRDDRFVYQGGLAAPPSPGLSEKVAIPRFLFYNIEQIF